LGLRLAILILLLGLLWSTGPYFYKGHKGCSDCHVPHYETEASCVDCHRGDHRTDRPQIAHYRLIRGEYACFTLVDSLAVKDGCRLISTSGCRRCHRTGRKGNGFATDLDTSFEQTLPEALADAIVNPAIFMPVFYFQEAAVTHLVNAILKSSAMYSPASIEDGRIIYFEKDKEDIHNIFTNQCGPCHRILTEQFGGLGRGIVGPNLSGIFSPYYFKNFKAGKSWNPDRLEQWLKNPRDIRSNARMQPIKLKEDELKRLIHIMNS